MPNSVNYTFSFSFFLDLFTDLMTSIANYVVDLQLVPNSENSEVKNISISGHVQVFLQLSDNNTKLKYRVFITYTPTIVLSWIYFAHLVTTLDFVLPLKMASWWWSRGPGRLFSQKVVTRKSKFSSINNNLMYFCNSRNFFEKDRGLNLLFSQKV